MVKHRVLSPGPVAARGEGLSITYGFHASPFGDMLLLAVDGAMIGAAFRNDDARETRDDTLADMRRRWPVASYVHDAGQGKRGATAALARLMFEPGDAKAPGETLRLALIGSAFDVRVWEALLLIPIAAAVTYRALAMHLGKPTAARAIGSAVGHNPISFTVPCHRVLRGDGALGGYHWGLTRKRAMLCWEAGHNI